MAGHFDLVLLRDVIEHLEETELSLRHVMDFMKPGGWLYVVFPALLFTIRSASAFSP